MKVVLGRMNTAGEDGKTPSVGLIWFAKLMRRAMLLLPLLVIQEGVSAPIGYSSIPAMSRKETQRQQIADAERTKEELASSGIPVFGRWVDGTGVYAQYRAGAISRTVSERLNDYYSRCLERRPLRELAPNGLANWKKKHIQWRTYDKLKGPRFSAYYSKFTVLVDQVAYIASECFQYKIAPDSAETVKLINEILGPSSYFRWENLTYKQGNTRWLDSKFKEIEEYLHKKMDELDVIHQREHNSWIVAHNSDYIRRKSHLQMVRSERAAERRHQEQLAALEKMQERIKELEEEAASAAMEAQDATQRLNEMQNEVDEAQRRASDAEDMLHNLRMH